MRLRKRKLFSGTGTGVDLEDIPVESDYKGPRIKFPITLQNLQEIIDAFNGKKVNAKSWPFSSGGKKAIGRLIHGDHLVNPAHNILWRFNSPVSHLSDPFTAV
jgi:hypothetical protein